MTVMKYGAFAAVILTTLSACGATDSDPGPGGVTAGEAEMLDDAAEMLDEQMAPPAVHTAPAPAETQSSPDAKPSAEP